MQGKVLQVAEKRGYVRRSVAFKQMALERMKNCPNIGRLAEELGVCRRLLYHWKNKLGPVLKDAPSIPEAEPRAKARELDLKQQLERFKRLAAEKTLEADSFKGALHKIAARRQSRGKSGETASMPRLER